MKGTVLTKGKFLISAPFLNDVFKRSVILLTEHNEEGSVGFIVNKPTEFKLHEIIEDFPEFDSKVYIGGPVEQESLNFIHRANNILEGGYEIKEGLYWGGNFEMLKLLIRNGDINPDDFKFFLGYAGWSPEQLDNEVRLNSWYLKNSSIDNIFEKENSAPSVLWSKILKSMGKEYSVMASFPDDPSVN